MISREDRILAIDLIEEAVSHGAREIKACDVLNISQRTLFRWRSKNEPNEDQRPLIKRPEPSNKLTIQPGFSYTHDEVGIGTPSAS